MGLLIVFPSCCLPQLVPLSPQTPVEKLAKNDAIRQRMKERRASLDKENASNSNQIIVLDGSKQKHFFPSSPQDTPPLQLKKKGPRVALKEFSSAKAAPSAVVSTSTPLPPQESERNYVDGTPASKDPSIATAFEDAVADVSDTSTNISSCNTSLNQSYWAMMEDYFDDQQQAGTKPNNSTIEQQQQLMEALWNQGQGKDHPLFNGTTETDTPQWLRHFRGTATDGDSQLQEPVPSIGGDKISPIKQVHDQRQKRSKEALMSTPLPRRIVTFAEAGSDSNKSRSGSSSECKNTGESRVSQLEAQLQEARVQAQHERKRRKASEIKTSELLLRLKEDLDDNDETPKAGSSAVKPKRKKQSTEHRRRKSASAVNLPTSNDMPLWERNKTLVKEVRFADQTCVELAGEKRSLETQLELLREQLKDAKAQREVDTQSLWTAQEQATSAQEQNADLLSQVSSLQASLREEATKYQQERRALEDQIAELKKETTSRVGNDSQTSGSAVDESRRVLELELELEMISQENGQLKADVERLGIAQVEKESNTDTYSLKTKELERDLSDARGEMSSLQSQLEQAHKELEELRLSKEETVSKLKACTKERAASLLDQKRLQEHVDNLIPQLAEANAKNLRGEARIKDLLIQQRSEIDSAVSAQEELQSKVADVAAQTHRHSLERDEALRQQASLQAANSSLQNSLRKTQDDKEHLESSLRKLRRESLDRESNHAVAVEKIEALVLKVEDLEAQNVIVMNDRDRLQELVHVKQGNEETPPHTDSLVELREQLEVKKQEVAMLRSSLLEQKDDKENDMREIDLAREKAAKLQSMLDDARADNNILRRRFANLEEEIQLKTGESDALTLEINALRDQLDEYEEANDEVVAENEILTERLHAAELEVQSHSSDIQAKESKLLACLQELHDLKIKLQSAESDHLKKEEQLSRKINVAASNLKLKSDLVEFRLAEKAQELSDKVVRMHTLFHHIQDSVVFDDVKQETELQHTSVNELEEVATLALDAPPLGRINNDSFEIEVMEEARTSTPSRSEAVAPSVRSLTPFLEATREVSTNDDRAVLLSGDKSSVRSELFVSLEERQSILQKLQSSEDSRNEVEATLQKISADLVSLGQENNQLRCQVKQISTERDQLNDTVGSLSADKADLQSRLDSVSREAHLLKEEKSCSTKEYAALQDELERKSIALRKAIAQNELHMSEVKQQLHKQNQEKVDLVQTIDGLTKEVGVLETELSSRSNYEKEISILRAECSASKCELQKAEASLRLLQNESLKIEGHQQRMLAEKQEIQEALFSCQDEVHNLGNKLAEKEVFAQATAAKLQHVEVALNKITEEYVGSNEKVAELIEKCQERKLENEKYQALLSAAEGRSEDAEKKVTTVQEKLEEVLLRYDEVQMVNTSLEVDLKAARDSLATHSQLSNVKPNETSIVDTTAGETVIVALSDKNQALERKCSRLKDYVRKLRSKCDEWEKYYDQQTVFLEKLKASNSRTRENASKLAQWYQQQDQVCQNSRWNLSC